MYILFIHRVFIHCICFSVLPYPTSSLNDAELKLNVFIVVIGEGVICLLTHAGHMRVTEHSGCIKTSHLT